MISDLCWTLVVLVGISCITLLSLKGCQMEHEIEMRCIELKTEHCPR